MTPSQIVRKCWAEELKAAGKATEGRMLDEMVEQEMKGAKEKATLEAEIGKDPASGGKKVEATPPVEAGGPTRGNAESRLENDQGFVPR